jgi:B12-binding domain/radical SAM domain protein
MSNIQKKSLVFRRTPSNRFSIPVLLNRLETESLDHCFNLGFADSSPSLMESLGDAPAIVVWSFMTPHLPEVRWEIESLKRNHPNAVLIAGGPHPTGDPDGTLSMGIDAVFVGEAENTFPEFCRYYFETGRVDQTIWKSEFSFPLDESYPFNRYDNLVPPLEITRGCSHVCRFCQTGSSDGVVHRSHESIEWYLDELIRQNRKYRCGFISPSGFEFGAPETEERIGLLLASAKAHGIRHVEYGLFPSEVRPETVTDGLMRLVKKFCTNQHITLGGQSGSASMLKRLGRGHHPEDIERAAAVIHSHGFRPMVDFIIAYPGESDEDREQTVDLIRRLHLKSNARMHIHHFIPLAGTPLARSKPSSINAHWEAVFDKLHKDGLCNNWWREGRKQWERLAEDPAMKF